MSLKNHWDKIYATKQISEMSWTQRQAEKSLFLIDRTRLANTARVIDVGSGNSVLIDNLLARKFRDLTVLDISGAAIQQTKKRLGSLASQIEWIEDDITDVELPKARYDIWHDRAVFHFLTKPSEREAYVTQMESALSPEGFAVVATFNLEGPKKCSGLQTMRYSEQTLGLEMGESFYLVDYVSEAHSTPWASPQSFIYCLFKKKQD